MTVLLVAMLAGSLVALALGVAGVRRIGSVALVGEVVMPAAMVDTHVPVLGLVPAAFWAVLLGGCAMVTALVDRLRRAERPAPPVGDHLHTVGMLLGAVFVLLGSAGHAVDGGHHHGAGLLLPVGVAVAVHAGAVLWSVLGTPALRREVVRRDVVRRVASLVGVLAMGAMAVGH